VVPSGQQRLEPRHVEVGLLTRFDQHALALHHGLGCRREPLERGLRDHDGAVPVGVEPVTGRDTHACDRDWHSDLDRVHVGVRGTHRAGEHLEARRQLVEVANAAVGDHAARAEPPVHVAVHLAPPRAGARHGVQIFDHGDRGVRWFANMSVVCAEHASLIGGAAAGGGGRADRRGPRPRDDRRQSRMRTEQ
jgi:hypothetical protein